MFKSKYSGYRSDGVRILPFGGKKSQDTTATTNTTDARQVNTSTVNDLSQSNSNNSTTLWDQAQTNSNNTTAAFTTNTSTSNSNNTTAAFTTNTSTSNANSNNTSAAFTTIDNRVSNVLDGGAIGGIVGVAGNALSSMSAAVAGAFGLSGAAVAGSSAATAGAYDFADGIFHASLDAMQENDTKAFDAWDRAATMQSKASASSLATLQNAYADAKGTTQASQQMMMALAAVAALAVLSRKG